MIIRTVLDLRTKLPKYLLQSVLLAASWHRYAREFAPLEILTIGDLPPHMREFLVSLGATIRKTDPSPNDSFSKTSNTIQGAAPVPDQQIFLLDNDVVLTGSISPLADLPRDNFYAALSSGYRVRADRWRVIHAELGLRPLTTSAIPPKEQVRNLIDPSYMPRQLDVVYVNGGVLLIPSGYDFKTTWEKQQATITSFFDGHPLACKNVTHSNMASLATSIQSYGMFDWLPIAFNYRPSCFVLGLCHADEIRLVHMTGMQHRHRARSLTEWVDEYWQLKMNTAFDDLESVLPKQMLDERIATAHAVRANVIGTTKDYDLDDLFRIASL